MNDSDTITHALLAKASAGDVRAREELLALQRDRLRRMVTARLDRRLAARIDPSDIVQDALCDAAGKLDGYLHDRPLPFYPWLYQLAREWVIRTHRWHFNSVRDPRREQAIGTELSDSSIVRFAKAVADSTSTPSEQLAHYEGKVQMRDALGRLSEKDREVLIMRFTENLPFSEIAAILGQSEGAVKMRCVRALEKVRRLLSDGNSNDDWVG